MKSNITPRYTQATLNDVGRITDGRVGDISVIPTNTIDFIYAHNLTKVKRQHTYLSYAITDRKNISLNVSTVKSMVTRFNTNGISPPQHAI